jgi:hypothetical protein
MLFDIHIRTTRAAYGLAKLSIMAADFSIVSFFAGELPGTSWRSSPGVIEIAGGAFIQCRDILPDLSRERSNA